MMLTIGVTVYNTEEKLLRQCLDSILRQRAEGLEILIGDDCSGEKTANLCREYAGKDGRIRIIRFDENVGVSAVRNELIRQATGKWIAFTDSDDIISEDMAEDIIENGGENDIILYNYSVFSDSVKAAEENEKIISVQLSGDTIEKLSVSCLTNSPMPPEAKAVSSAVWGRAFGTEFLKQNNISFIPGLKKAEDALFNTEAFSCAKNVILRKKIVYFYRLNPQSATKKFNRDFFKITEDVLGASKEVLEKLYKGREDVLRLYTDYRRANALADLLKITFFHRDNPDDIKTVKREFLKLLEREPYNSILKEADPSGNENNDKRLIIILAKKKCFRTLKFVCRHEFCFKLYGFLSYRTKLIKRRLLKRWS